MVVSLVSPSLNCRTARCRRSRAVPQHRGERVLAAPFELDEGLRLVVERERRRLPVAGGPSESRAISSRARASACSRSIVMSSATMEKACGNGRRGGPPAGGGRGGIPPQNAGRFPEASF